MTTATDTLVEAGPVAAPSRPPVRRSPTRDNGDVLGVGWLHGSLIFAVFRRQKLQGSWSAPKPVKTMEEFGGVLDEALLELKFGGTEVFLLLENDQFVHQIEGTPPFSDSVARAFLHGRVERHEKEHAPVLWVGQPAAGLKKERSFILHMLPKSFYDGFARVLLERRLDLTRIMPLVVPVQRELDRFPIAKGRPVLVAVEAGGATVVMVAKVGDELLFARTILATWSADPGRIGVEINRSLLYANQQFGMTVDRVWLLGQDNHATAEVNAKCGTGRQITVLPTTPVEWLQSAAKLSPRHPVNLVAGHLQRKSRQRSVRRGLLLICWLGLASLAFDSWTKAQLWNADQRRFAQISATAPNLNAERERLLARNQTVQRNRDFIRQVEEQRLPPVPGKFAAYLAGILPGEIRLTELIVKWEDSATGGWSFRLEGSVEADEETAREIVAGLQRQLAKSPLRVRISETARTVVPVQRAAGSTAPDLQRFSLEGVMLEN